MGKPWNPEEYDAWYKTSLGALCDKLEKELVFSLFEIKHGDAVLDVGCGTGNYSIELAKRGADVIGIDSAEEMSDWARVKAQKAGTEASFQVADAMNLPFPDSSFDTIISNGLLCFLKEPEKALIEMHRVLKPGGRLVVGALNRWSSWALFRRVKGLIKDTIYNQAHFISPPELERLIRGVGFDVKETRTCLFFFPINNRVYLKIAAPFERLNRRLIAKTGAFLAVSAAKAM